MSGRALGLWLLLLAALAAGVLLWFQDGRDRTEGAAGRAEQGAAAALEGAAPLDPEGLTGLSGTRRDTATPPPRDSTTIHGRVTAADGQPLSGLRVALLPVQSFDEIGVRRSLIEARAEPASAQGFFALQPSGEAAAYRVAALADGYGAQRSAPVAPGAEVNLQLEPALEVQGEVVDSGGRPVSLATVDLRGVAFGQDGLPDPVESGRDGRFSLEAPGAGQYRLWVRSAAGVDVELNPLSVTPDMKPLRVVVEGEPGLLVRLRDEQGEPVVGARLSLTPRGHTQTVRLPRKAATDQAGESQFLSLDQGVWQLQVTAPGFAVLEEAIVRNQPGLQLWERTLQRGAGLRVSVVDLQGRPAADFEVILFPAEPGQSLHAAAPRQSTNESGVVHWRDLVPGRYFLVGGGGLGWQQELEGSLAEVAAARAWQAQGSHLLVEVLPGQESAVELLLRSHARLAVQLLDAGIPCPGARVSLRQGLGRSASLPPAFATGVTGADGRALLSPIWPGTYQLVVEIGGTRALDGLRVELEGGFQERTVELPLGSLYGLVQGDEGEPLANVRIEARDAAGQWVAREGRSGADGGFELRYLEKGDYRVRLEAEGYLPLELPPWSHDGRGRESLGTLFLERACFLEGVAENLPAHQTLFAVSTVDLLDVQGAKLGTQILQADQRFRFGPVPSGDYVLQFFHNGVPVGSATVTLERGKNEFRYQHR